MTSVSNRTKPLNKQYVRAKGGQMWIFHPVAGEKHATRAVRLLRVNPMGSIPGWAISLLKSKNAEAWTKIFSYLNEHVLPHRKEEPEPVIAPVAPLTKPPAVGNANTSLLTPTSTEDDLIEELPSVSQPKSQPRRRIQVGTSYFPFSCNQA
jgi:hypothetical protein